MIKGEYLAVGTTNEMDRVTIVSSNHVIYLQEDTARKLADDILRNANWLWPVEDTNQDDLEEAEEEKVNVS